MRFVDDRPGHDRRYSLDASKLARLGFTPATPFEEGLTETVRWYRDHEEWWRPIKERDAAYREFYRSQYGQRPRDLVRDRQGAGLTASRDGRTRAEPPLDTHAAVLAAPRPVPRAAAPRPDHRRLRDARARTSLPCSPPRATRCWPGRRPDLDIADAAAVSRALRRARARRPRQLRGVHEGRRLRDRPPRLRGQRRRRWAPRRRLRARHGPAGPDLDGLRLRRRQAPRRTSRTIPSIRSRPTDEASAPARSRRCGCPAASSCGRRGSSAARAGTSSRRS